MFVFTRFNLWVELDYAVWLELSLQSISKQTRDGTNDSKKIEILLHFLCTRYAHCPFIRVFVSFYDEKKQRRLEINTRFNRFGDDEWGPFLRKTINRNKGPLHTLEFQSWTTNWSIPSRIRLKDLEMSFAFAEFIKRNQKPFVLWTEPRWEKNWVVRSVPLLRSIWNEIPSNKSGTGMPTAESGIWNINIDMKGNLIKQIFLIHTSIFWKLTCA